MIIWRGILIYINPLLWCRDLPYRSDHLFHLRHWLAVWHSSEHQEQEYCPQKSCFGCSSWYTTYLWTEVSEYFCIRILFEYLRPNTSHWNCIRVTFWNRISLVFVIGRFSQTEYYSYSHSCHFSNKILFVFGWLFETEYY